MHIFYNKNSTLKAKNNLKREQSQKPFQLEVKGIKVLKV